MDIITGTLDASCGLCNGRKPFVATFKSLSGASPQKISEMRVRAAIGEEFHISFPILGSSEMTRFMGENAFVTLVKSTGVATLVRNEVDRTAKTKAAFGAMLSIWPMYIILILTTLLAGIVMWFLVSMPLYLHHSPSYEIDGPFWVIPTMFFWYHQSLRAIKSLLTFFP